MFGALGGGVVRSEVSLPGLGGLSVWGEWMWRGAVEGVFAWFGRSE